MRHGYGWIGVDLDGTLARDLERPSTVYDIGEPVPAMLERVRAWIESGIEVRIITARVAITSSSNIHEERDKAALAQEQRRQIQQWCREHVGVELEVTSSKDYMMRELWDDRAVQVVKDTGERVGKVER